MRQGGIGGSGSRSEWLHESVVVRVSSSQLDVHQGNWDGGDTHHDGEGRGKGDLVRAVSAADIIEFQLCLVMQVATKGGNGLRHGNEGFVKPGGVRTR